MTTLVAIMAQEFLPNPDASSAPPNPPFDRSSKPDREPVRLMLVGSRHGITTIIHTLHVKRFAPADEWSDFQIEPMTGQWMCVLTKYVGLE
jgi:hypothetical protein